MTGFEGGGVPQEEMTQEEFQKQLRSLVDRRNAVLAKLAEVVRPIIPMLKDHNLLNVAKGLDEKLFELDVLTDEMVELMRGNTHALVALLIKRHP